MAKKGALLHDHEIAGLKLLFCTLSACSMQLYIQNSLHLTLTKERRKVLSFNSGRQHASLLQVLDHAVLPEKQSLALVKHYAVT